MNSYRWTIGTLIFVFFFGGSLVDYGLFPSAVNSVLPDLIISILFLGAIHHCARAGRRFRVVGLKYALFFLICAAFSLVSSGLSLLSGGLFLRLIFRFYVLFLALINQGIAERDQRWTLRVLIFLFILQIPVAIVKLFVFGQGESAIGTYATHGGGYSTAIPMLAAAFLVSLYIAYKRRPLYIVLLIAFIAFGIIGGKRAIFVMVPIVGLFAMMVSMRMRTGALLRLAPQLSVLLLVFCLVIYFAIRLTPTLTPERRVMGSFDIGHVTNYMMTDQVNSYAADGAAQGRFSSTLVFLERVHSDATTVLFGLGPGILLKSGFEGVGRGDSVDVHGTRYGGAVRGFDVLYGITGFVWLLAQIGWPGTIAWLMFYFVLLRRFLLWARDDPNDFWCAYYRGMAGYALSILIITFAYGSYMISGDLLTFTFFLLSAIGFVRADRLKNYAG